MHDSIRHSVEIIAAGIAKNPALLAKAKWPAKAP